MSLTWKVWFQHKREMLVDYLNLGCRISMVQRRVTGKVMRTWQAPEECVKHWTWTHEGMCMQATC